jgi:hypothetical protein
MGSTVTRGEVEGTVQATGGNTFFGKSPSIHPSIHGCVLAEPAVLADEV